MKKWISILSILLALTVLLCACAVEPEPTAAPTAAPTNEPTTEPTELPPTEPTAAPTIPPTNPPTEPPTEPTEPVTEPPTEPLSLEEQFQNLLSYDGDYWLWRILGCTFEDPMDISVKHLFYNGLKHDQQENRDDYSDDEVAFLRAYAKDSVWRDEEVWVNALKIPGETFSTVLESYLGIPADEVTIPEDWTYFAETDAYYSIRSDGYGISGHRVTEVIVLEDGTIQVCWTVGLLKNTHTGEYMENPEMVLTLKETDDGGYQVLSNHPLVAPTE